jgi:hypothetical protein
MFDCVFFVDILSLSVENKFLLNFNVFDLFLFRWKFDVRKLLFFNKLSFDIKLFVNSLFLLKFKMLLFMILLKMVSNSFCFVFFIMHELFLLLLLLLSKSERKD